MPDPISSTNRPAFDACDPANASCGGGEPPPAAIAPAAVPVVTIDPVVITGDAGAQELLRRYQDSQTCSAEKQNATLSCLGIGTGMLSTLRGDPVTGIASSLQASLTCGKDLRSIYDCNETNAELSARRAQVVADCHERDGVVKPGAWSNEIICEVTR